MCNAQLRVIISRINRTYMLRNISTNMMVKMGRGIILPETVQSEKIDIGTMIISVEHTYLILKLRFPEFRE
jgi:hypothetical protein